MCTVERSHITYMKQRENGTYTPISLYLLYV